MDTNKKQRVYKVIMLLVLTSLITFIITSIAMYRKFDSTLKLSNTSDNGNNDEFIEKMSEFKQILNETYIGDMDETKMQDAAIKGYISGIGDKYTEYLTKEEMSELMESTSGKYVGIGVYLTDNTEDNTILILGVMKGSPALDAGIQAGDIIEKVEGTEYKGEELDEAISILKGEEGSKVHITILRDDKEIEMDVIRKTITIEHVSSKVMDEGIGYIQIDSFDDGVAKTFETELRGLQEANIKGLIIDLRSNGGGVVDEATEIADLFTKKGDTVLITKDKSEKEILTKSKVDPIVKNIPVVVLVNEGTASASEILAGALRDNYNATIVGKKTYGKGVIQTVYKLSDGSGLKITTEEYFTPKHTAINHVGIEPDQSVDLTKDADGKYEITEDKDAQLLKAKEIINNK